MALTIISNRAKTKKAKMINVEATASKEHIDMAASLKEHVEGLKARLKEAEKSYNKEIKAILETLVDAPKDEIVTLVGNDKTLTFSAMGNATEVTDVETAFTYLDKVKEGLGAELIRYGITDLKKYLTEDELKAVTHTARTKARVVKVTTNT